MADEQIIVKYQGQEQPVTIADIAGNLDMAGIEMNFGFEALPAGTYLFECSAAIIDTATYTVQKTGQETTSGVVDFTLDVIDVLTLKDQTKDKADLVGNEMRERFFIKDLKQDLGKVQALLSMAGKPAVGRLDESLNTFIRHRFVSEVTNRPDKNDKDKFYANLNLRAVRPLMAGEGGMEAPMPPAAQPVAPPAAQVVAPQDVVAVVPAPAPAAPPAPATGVFAPPAAPQAPSLAGLVNPAT